MIRLAIRLRAEHAELVLAELLELAPAGVEEVALGDGEIEYAVYGPPGELPRLPEVQALAGEALVQISTREIPDDWHERWRQFHRPVLVGAPAPAAGARRVPAIHVRPPWEAPSGAPEVSEIVIDPAQAFGTGAHATTHLCLELLLELAAVAEPPLGAVIDLGTGSGVLAIAAAILGFVPVIGLDNDPESILAATENARVNEASVELRLFDLRAEPLPGVAAPPQGTAGQPPTVVIANLLRPLLAELSTRLASPPAHLIASGLLRAEAPEISRAFTTRLGMREHARRERGEWAALWLSAPQPASASSVAAQTIER